MSLIVGMAPVFSDTIVGQFPGSDKYFPYLHCPGSTYFDCTVDPGSSSLVIFEKYFVFYFLLSQVQTITSTSFFQKLVISVAPFKLWDLELFFLRFL